MPLATPATNATMIQPDETMASDYVGAAWRVKLFRLELPDACFQGNGVGFVAGLSPARVQLDFQVAQFVQFVALQHGVSLGFHRREAIWSRGARVVNYPVPQVRNNCATALL